MIVLKLWSDEHRRTPIDIFVYEPFDFDLEFERSVLHELGNGDSAGIVALEALIQMKAEAGRDQDLIDIGELRRAERLNNEQA